MKTVAPFSIPALLNALVLSTAVFSTLPPPAMSDYACCANERMMCYHAAGYEEIETGNCIADLDSVLDRAVEYCLEDNSNIGDDHYVAVFQPVELTARLGGEDESKDDSDDESKDGSRDNRRVLGDPAFEKECHDEERQHRRRTLTLVSVGSNRRQLPRIRAGSKTSVNGGCTMCIQDCVSLGTCLDAVRRRRTAATAEKKTTMTAAAWSLRGDAVVRSLKDAPDKAYDYSRVAKCIGAVLTFEAQFLCPETKLTQGYFGPCPAG